MENSPQRAAFRERRCGGTRWLCAFQPDVSQAFATRFAFQELGALTGPELRDVRVDMLWV